jgi:hypothetical protein
VVGAGRLFMKITGSNLRGFLITILSIFAPISISGCSDKAAVSPVPIVVSGAPPATCEIVGFYGAPNNGGTFVRTVKQAPVKVGDAVLVTGTGFYDGKWTVLQTLLYQDARDPQQLWGYRIEPRWQGYPPGFIDNDGFPIRNTAKLQPLPAR